jgi:hypothetical protein
MDRQQGVPIGSADCVEAVDFRPARACVFSLCRYLPKKVVKAVDHALASKRPKRRYLLDTVSRAQKAVVAMTPTAINDAILSAATTSK